MINLKAKNIFAQSGFVGKGVLPQENKLNTLNKKEALPLTVF